MSSRRLQLWAWWLLPFLVARALVPVGFMAQAAHGQLHIVLCQSGAPQLAATWQPTGDANAAQRNTTDSSQTKHWQHDVSCPFGHLAAAPLLVLHGADDLPAIADAVVVVDTTSVYLATGPPRVITNRGPPALI